MNLNEFNSLIDLFFYQVEKQNEIDKELSKVFKEAEREYVSKKKHPADESGKSNVTYIMYWFKSGDFVSIDCTDWSSKMKPRTDNLNISLVTKVNPKVGTP